VTRNNLFSEAGAAASFQRPLLCLFDRNFELAVAVQHVWTYQPLVHDVLGLTLNRTTVTVKPTPLTAPPLSPSARGQLQVSSRPLQVSTQACLSVEARRASLTNGVPMGCRSEQKCSVDSMRVCGVCDGTGGEPGCTGVQERVHPGGQ
jgi:hypothetical protein